MLRIAICDDEEIEQKLIYAFTKEYIKEKAIINCDIQTYNSSFELLETVEKGAYFDIYLLDVCMPQINGINVAKEIRETNQSAQIVFITTSTDYAIDAFSVNATHYLLKPYNRQSFFAAMDKTYKNVKQNIGKTVTLKTQGGSLFVVDINDIIYVEANRHSLTMHCIKEEKQIIGTLSLILKELQTLTTPNQFIIPFKGYIINQKNIKEITPRAIILVNECTIPMARGIQLIVLQHH